MTTNIMLYSDEIMRNVRTVLWSIKENGGKITSKHLQTQVDALKGSWASESVNIALMALGRQQAVNGMVASQPQIDSLLAKFVRENAYLVDEVKALREARAKDKEAKATQETSPEEPTIAIVDLSDEYDPNWHDDGLEITQKKWAITSTSTAAEILGVSERRVQAMIAAGQFKSAEKFGTSWLLRGEEVQLLATKERKAGRPARSAENE
jgi:excisionase family DNA binding protein